MAARAPGSRVARLADLPRETLAAVAQHLHSGDVRALARSGAAGVVALRGDYRARRAAEHRAAAADRRAVDAVEGFLVALVAGPRRGGIQVGFAVGPARFVAALRPMARASRHHTVVDLLADGGGAAARRLAEARVSFGGRTVELVAAGPPAGPDEGRALRVFRDAVLRAAGRWQLVATRVY